MVRIASSMKQLNDNPDFPVAYGADLWLDKNKGEGTPDYATLQSMYNTGDLGGGGSDIEVTSMPDASASYLDKVLLYVGETGTYEYGKFYKCVSDGGTSPSYSWEDAGIGSDPVDGTTIVKDSSTGELSAVQATQSTKGIVKGGNGTQIGSNGEVNVVNRLEETTELPTATAANERKCYLLTAAQTGYTVGGTYQSQEVTPATEPKTYHWVLISAADVDLSKYKKIFMGAKDDFLALPEATRKEYDELHTSDSLDASQEPQLYSNVVTPASGISTARNSIIVNGNLAILDLFLYGSDNIPCNGSVVATISNASLRPKYEMTFSIMVSPRFNSDGQPANLSIYTDGSIKITANGSPNVGEVYADGLCFPL